MAAVTPSGSTSDGSAVVGGTTPDRAVIDLRNQLESTNAQVASREFGLVEENILKGYTNVTYGWTMVPLSQEQLKKLQEGTLPTLLNDVIFSTAGRFDKERVEIYDASNAGRAKPEYFINNVEINTFATPTRISGLSGNLTINFDIIEPYSLGLFMQSLQAAALKSGWTNYIECPYLLKLQFFGTTPGGQQIQIPASRDYPIKLQQISFTANEGGSKYIVKAIDFNLEAFNNVYGSYYSSVDIEAANVGEALTALDIVLNKDQQTKKDEGLIETPDFYRINIEGPLQSTIQQSKFANIGQQPSNKGSKTKTTQNQTAVVRSTPVPGTRAFNWAKQERGLRIIDMIEEIMKSSEYCTNALKPENISKKGYVNWYRVSAKIEPKGKKWEVDAIQNRPAYNITYVIKPYKTHHSNFKVGSDPTIGLQDIATTIRKKYQYLYTGQNDEIVRWELKFDNTFYTAMSTQGFGNQRGAIDSAGKTVTTQGTGGNQPGTNTVGLTQLTPAGRLLAASESYKKPMGGGTVDDVAIRVARAFEQSLLLDTEMITLDLTILGDPYYLSKSGVFLDFVQPVNEEAQINNDGTMASEDIEIRVYLSFKSPVDGPLMGQSFYQFPAAGFTDSPYSGLYRVRTVKSKFNDGVFTQELNLFRDRGQQTEEIKNRRQDPNLQIIGQAPAPDPRAAQVQNSAPAPASAPAPVASSSATSTAVTLTTVTPQDLPPLTSSEQREGLERSTFRADAAQVQTQVVPTANDQIEVTRNGQPVDRSRSSSQGPTNKTGPIGGKIEIPAGATDAQIEDIARRNGVIQ